ncbi:MAG TPA: hypothetical protein VG713_00560, partial [Pirellulales bacterium]|nr:hypothetical protein [Pirellulales bacterium]
AGYKSVENRTWPTNHRGWIAVHAGSSKRGLTDDALEFLIDTHSQIADVLDDPTITPEKLDELGFGLGAIIGAVEIVGCLEVYQQRPLAKGVEELGYQAWYANRRLDIPHERWCDDGYYAWLLGQAVKFKAPIKCPGRVSLWRLGPDLERAVADAMAAASCSPA